MKSVRVAGIDAELNYGICAGNVAPVIAIDTRSLVAYLSGHPGQDVEATAVAIEHRQAALPLVVLSELLSDPVLPRPVKGLLVELPLLEVTGGYWERAGLLRARLLRRGHTGAAPTP